MTISSTTRKAGPYSGTGAQVAFPFAFKVFTTGDLLVVQTNSSGVETTLQLGTDYSVALNADQNGSPGGTVNLVAAPPVGALLTLGSAVQSTQGQSIPNQGGFYPKVIENALDKLTITVQQLAESVGRSVKLAFSDTGSASLPSASARANKLLSFDANGNPVAIAAASDSATALQFMLVAAAGSSMVGFSEASAAAVPRSVQDRLRDTVSVKDFGAKGDGIANDTAALVAAVNSLGAGGGEVLLPAGAYRIDPIVFNGKNYLRLRGAGRENTQIILNSAGTALTFSNCAWLTLRDIKILPSGVGQSLANAYGVQLDTGSNNSHIESVDIVGFSKDGVRFIGGPGAAVLSGNKVTNCYFLGNAGNQLYSYYSADFHFLHNQFGGLGGLATPATGVLLDHSDAGEYFANYHYGNVIGWKMTNSNYNRVIGNRFEESNQQGVYVDTVADMVFTSNTIHTNSLSSKGTYDNAYFKNIGSSIFADNNSFDWSGGTSGHRWGMYFDTGCDSVHIKNNKCHTGYAANSGPIYVNPSNVRVNVDAVLQSSTAGTLAANTTAYLGSTGQQAIEANAHFIAGRRAMVQSFAANHLIAPGPNQTTTYMLYKNGIATGMTASATGGNGYIASTGATSPPIYVEELDTLSLQVVSGAGANATQIAYFIKLTDY